MSLTDTLATHTADVLTQVDPALAEQFEREVAVWHVPTDLSDRRRFTACRFGGWIEEDGGLYDELPVPCRPEVA